jgi:hypothetical protein
VLFSRWERNINTSWMGRMLIWLCRGYYEASHCGWNVVCYAKCSLPCTSSKETCWWLARKHQVRIRFLPYSSKASMEHLQGSHTMWNHRIFQHSTCYWWGWDITWMYCWPI